MLGVPLLRNTSFVPGAIHEGQVLPEWNCDVYVLHLQTTQVRLPCSKHFQCHLLTLLAKREKLLSNMHFCLQIQPK